MLSTAQRFDIPPYEEMALYYPQSNQKRPMILVGPPSIGRHELRQSLLEDTTRFAAAVPRKLGVTRAGANPIKVSTPWDNFTNASYRGSMNPALSMFLKYGFWSTFSKLAWQMELCFSHLTWQGPMELWFLHLTWQGPTHHCYRAVALKYMHLLILLQPCHSCSSKVRARTYYPRQQEFFFTLWTRGISMCTYLYPTATHSWL